MRSGVYKIVNVVNNKLYVGSSIDYKARKASHLRDLKEGTHHCIYLQRAYNKYGRASFKFFLLEKCTADMLIEREQFYLDTLNPEYNTFRVAGSSLGYKRSEESKEKARIYAKENNVKPPESTWLDKQLKVYQLNKTTLEVINEYKSLAEACRAIGKDATFATVISSCCTNKRYSAYGYRWVFSLDDIPFLRNVIKKDPWNKGKKIDNRKSKPIYQYSMDGVFIKEWESIKEAESVYGKGAGNCARGVSKSSNNFKWKFNKI